MRLAIGMMELVFYGINYPIIGVVILIDVNSLPSKRDSVLMAGLLRRSSHDKAGCITRKHKEVQYPPFVFH